jgi:hypothetical protein
MRRANVLAALLTSYGLVFGAGGADAKSIYGLSTLSGYSNPASLFGYCKDPAAVPCPVNQLAGYAVAGSQTAESAAFGALLGNMGGAGHMGWARFSIPYDALAVENSSKTGCTASPGNAQGGAADFNKLVWELQVAANDGLTPEVVFAPGRYGGPSFPFAGYGGTTPSTVPYAGETQAGMDYQCGVERIMTALAPNNSAGYPVVTNWEAWNEPNGASPGQHSYNGSLIGACATAGADNPCGQVVGSPNTSLCGSVTVFQFSQCGPIEASELWELAQATATRIAATTGVSENVAALTLSLATAASSTPWDNAYAVGIKGSAANPPTGFYPGAGREPSIWAVHDYADVTGWPQSGTPVISSFTSWLSSTFRPGLSVWITEAAVILRDPSNNNQQTAADGAPSVQSQQAKNFLQLSNPSYTNGEQVTALDWFEFQAGNQSSGWDSGLLSAPHGTLNSPDGTYSQQRQSYCVLIGSTTCTSSTAAASDWSTQQAAAYQPTGLTLGSVANTSASLSWTAPANPPAGITYSVWKNGTTQVASGLSAPSYTVTGLVAGAAYSFAVSASSPSGAASPSSAAVTVGNDGATVANNPVTGLPELALEAATGSLQVYFRASDGTWQSLEIGGADCLFTVVACG